MNSSRRAALIAAFALPAIIGMPLSANASSSDAPQALAPYQTQISALAAPGANPPSPEPQQTLLQAPAAPASFPASQPKPASSVIRSNTWPAGTSVVMILLVSLGVGVGLAALLSAVTGKKLHF
ncbi:MAG: hypothetical protein Q4G30_06635 [Actinomycetaceae bacterium]|nr:hypothetical protein [Actinomycetaceae bacterium]